MLPPRAKTIKKLKLKLKKDRRHEKPSLELWTVQENPKANSLLLLLLFPSEAEEGKSLLLKTPFILETGSRNP